MQYIKLADMFGLVVVSGALLYGVVVWSPDALTLGGLTAFVYGCMVLCPGLGGRTGAILLIPLMALFSLVLAVQSGEFVVSIVVSAGSARAGMLMWADSRRTYTHKLSA